MHTCGASFTSCTGGVLPASYIAYIINAELATRRGGVLGCLSLEPLNDVYVRYLRLLVEWGAPHLSQDKALNVLLITVTQGNTVLLR